MSKTYYINLFFHKKPSKKISIHLYYIKSKFILHYMAIANVDYIAFHCFLLINSLINLN